MLVKNPNLHIRRFEFKYLLKNRDLEQIRRAIANFVIADPNARYGGKYPVTSLYFDDHNYSCYDEKLAGLKMRQKFRVRSYSSKVTDASVVFLEIKKRDETIIFKDRSPLKFADFLSIFNLGKYEKLEHAGDRQVASDFFGHILKRRLRPTIVTSYLREAYFDEKNFSFRLTLDQDLSAAPEEEINLGNGNCHEILRGYSILEAKFNRIMPAWFGTVVKSFNLERIPFSKYCWALEYCGRVMRSEISTLAGLYGYN